MSAPLTFVDPAAPRPYSGRPGHLAGLGGTEATVVRLAEALSGPFRPVVRQSAWRGAGRTVAGVRYGRFAAGASLPEQPGTVVVINAWKVAVALRRLHPEAQILLWLHVYPGRHNRRMGPALKAAGVEVICVSRSQARWLRIFMGAERPVCRHIYNPVAPELVPDGTPRDPDLLLFASSPHKGLAEVFRHFERLRAARPALRLAVADPGYMDWPTGPVPEGVIGLGPLEPAALRWWMRRALCLFYPQASFAETFGLVIAEANALGCPALLQAGLGANDEIASHPEQCIDTADPDQIAARLEGWRQSVASGRRLAFGRSDFALRAVTGRWRTLLDEASAPLAKPLRPGGMATPWYGAAAPACAALPAE